MNFSNPSTLCLFVLVAIVVLLGIRTRSQLTRQRRRWSEEDTSAGDADGLRSFSARVNRASPDELAQWEVHMHETARDLSAQIDAKLGLLQSLIADADRAARRLETALDRADLAPPPESDGETMRPAIHQGGEAYLAIQDAGTELDCMTAEPAAGIDRSKRREEIFQLADYGFAPAEIAHRVGSPVGEVELILSLRGT